CDDESAEQARREIVAVTFKMQGVVEDLGVAQAFAGEHFVDRNAGDDRGAAASESAGQRDVAVNGETGAADLAFPLAGDEARDSRYQVRFVALDGHRAFSGRSDDESFGGA